ncbi:MAG TPA: DUF6770 family protein [Bacteroidia bacterium]|jgi:hypothetical protein|nr:DUF6770 family protein [Bacteroidia bacterium]
MKKTLLSVLFALTFFLSNSQQSNYDITGIKRINPRDLNAIIENNEVKGYYAFYFLDKANKKENLYNLAILDNTLKQTYSVEIKKGKHLRLMESSYNGTNFCFSFADFSKKTIEYMVLDKTGKEVGSYIVKVSKKEMMYYVRMMQSDDDSYSGGLTGIKGKGFIRYGFDKDKGLRIEIEMIDNMGKKVWSANSGTTAAKSYESAAPFYADENVLITGITMREKALTTKGTKSSIVFFNTTTGAQLFQMPITTDKYQLSALGASFNADSKTYFIFGQFYDLTDNIMKDDSKGMYIQEVDQKGKVVRETYNAWAGEINNLLLKKVNKDKYANNMKVFIHKVVKTADGKIFAIAEQYRKAVSASGVALKALALASGSGGGASVMKIELYDMLVYEFDNAFKIKDVYVYEKQKANIQLQSGLGTADANLLGYMMKLYGWFDYAYTAVSADRKQFNTAYVNYDKSVKKSEGSKSVIGTISYTKDQKLVADRVIVKSNPTDFWVLQAKPGYVAIFEYFRKEKKATLRLEKLNL